MKKLVSLMLALVLVAFCFVSCGENPGADKETDTQTEPEETTIQTEPEETTAQPEPEETEIDLSDYRIIVPDNHSNAEEEIFNSFFASLKEKIGKSLSFETDFINEALGYVETEREILIGNTNRKESAIETTDGGNSCEIKYLNKKIVINAENLYALEYALNKFIDDFAQSGSTVIEIPAIKEEAKTAYYKDLKGITLTALGDSYFADNPDVTSWLELLDAKYELNFINRGIGGSTISNHEPNDGKNHHPMVDRLDKLPAKTDIILFEGGRNDRTQGTPLGDDIESRDVKTFTGAINYIIDFLQEKYPNALLICVTAWKVDDPSESRNLLATTEYANKMAEICNHRGVVCFDATKIKVQGVKFDMNSKTFRAKYCLTEDDKSHLNSEGMKLVFPAFEKFIGEEYAKFLSSK